MCFGAPGRSRAVGSPWEDKPGIAAFDTQVTDAQLDCAIRTKFESWDKYPWGSGYALPSGESLRPLNDSGNLARLGAIVNGTLHGTVYLEKKTCNI